MKIAILGAGVGGLATAIALTQQGFEVQVYERRATITHIGAGIVCWPNATFVLEQLGLLEEVVEASGAVRRMDRIAADGQALGSLDITHINNLMGYPSLSILRKDLMRILNERVKELGIQINYGCNVCDITGNGSGRAVVHFESHAAIEPDAVIGADGRMNSIARRYVNGDSTPVYQGFINWVGVYHAPQSMFYELNVSDYWGVGSRFGIVPVNDKVAYWAGGVAATRIGRNDPENYKRDLWQLFEGWGSVISTIVEQTPVEHINKVYVHDHNHIDVWHKNNVLLIGDAAHAPLPTSGQGACQALEDAWHLARLFKQGGDLSQIYSSFTSLRSAKTQSIGYAGRYFASSLFNTDPAYCHQRNLDSINSDFVASAQGMAKLWGSQLI